jgi:hypothetical protein
LTANVQFSRRAATADESILLPHSKTRRDRRDGTALNPA